MFRNIYDKFIVFMKENWSFLLAVLAIILVFFVIKLPYTVEMPGGIINLNDRVKLDGKEIDIEGSFNMAYVSAVEGSIPHILLGLVLPDWDISPSSDITYENETIEEANTRNKLYLDQSKAYAKAVAFDHADIPYEISDKHNKIVYINTEAETDLKVGDELIEINDVEINDANTIANLVQENEVGDIINIKVRRDNKEVKCTAKIYEEDDKKYIGIGALTLFDIESDMDVDITSRASESGPSGGLMMTLMVYNAITGQDLTHGKKVVGTGTINLDGTVGEIGGVKYKLMGVVKNKADVFLVPEGNYEEAIKIKEEKGYDIEIVSVGTLEDAINYLEG